MWVNDGNASLPPPMPKSFVISTSAPSRVVRTALDGRLADDGTALLFLSGQLTEQASAIFEALRDKRPDITWIVACGAGAMTEDGEVEDEDAACGIFLDGPIPVLTAPAPDRAFGERLRDALLHEPRSCAQVFVQGDPSKDEWVDAVNGAGANVTARVVGAGVLSRAEVRVSSRRAVQQGGAIALLLGARLQSRTFSTSACRLISPLAEVTRARQGAVFELDGAPALDRLSEHGRSITDGSPVLIAIAGGNDALSPGGRTLALRGIEGVDPTQGALLIGEVVEPGVRIAFAVRDAHAARGDLENHLRSLSRAGAGAAPVFGLYTYSAGRGHSLYGSAHVESRLIRAAFPQMPLLGIKSSFEVAPVGGVLMSQILAGVFTCFSQPS